MAKLYRNAGTLLLYMLVLFIGPYAIAQPKAGFNVSAASGCSPLSETFTNTTTGGTTPYTYFWRLGNSNTSFNKDASAIYYLAKTYSITLIVTDAKGKMDSVTHSVTVFKSPVANFTPSSLNGCPPLSVYFADKSTAGSGPISAWLWDFGDGNTSTQQNPTHKYTTPGKYTISLNVTDKNGCSGSTVKNSLIEVFTPPTVDFSAATRSSCAPPLTVNFAPSVSFITASATYLWDFGDGTTSTSVSPSHSYSSLGSFTVTLTLTDGNGCSTTMSKLGYVYIGAPKVDFSYTPSGGCTPVLVNFTDLTTGASSKNTYYWDFGDGGTSTDENPYHVYGIGTWSVKFAVTTSGGCTDTLVKKFIITVGNGFVASFTADSILCNDPYTIHFFNTSSTKTTILSFDYGDGQEGSDVIHTYASSGVYDVKMTVEDRNGCIETVTKKNFVSAYNYTPIIDADPVQGCEPLRVTFGDGSYGDDSVVSYHWDFGDRTSSNVENPGLHVYSDTGIFYATLTILTKRGCIHVKKQRIKVGAKPKADFTAYPDSGCMNMLRHVHFLNLTNTGTGVEADSFYWNFGLSGTSIENPIVGYVNDKPGNYTVILTAFNNGCPDTMKKIGYIHIDPPWAQYYAYQDTCFFQNRVHFFDQSIGATRVVYYFGDNDSSTLRNPVHTYDTFGFFQPMEVVFDSINGCSDTFFYYSETLKTSLAIKPKWKFSLVADSPTTGCLPLMVQFVLKDNDTSFNRIVWGDGDTTEIFMENPYNEPFEDNIDTIYHEYSRNGIYQVRLQVTDIQGCRVDSIINPKIVVNGVNAKFSVKPESGCAPLKVTLYDSSDASNSVVSKYYYMGDGDSMKVTAPIMTYTYKRPPKNQGSGYTIALSILDKGGCLSTQLARVFPQGPAANFYTFYNATCDSVQYVFISTNQAKPPIKYLWDFGDGTKSTLEEPIKDYVPGNYKVLLTMTDSAGCKDTFSRPLLVQSNKSVADFDIKISTASCPPFTADFVDKSKFAVQGNKFWDWDFGDGSPHSYLQNPQKVYYTPGKFQITLKITDALGCVDTITKPNAVIIKGAVGDYSFDNKTGCIPLTVHFTAVTTDASKITWDLGDGTLGHGDTVTHVYKQSKHYLPLLILSDSFGCTYALPPKDTIFVYPNPIPDFSYDTTCAGVPVQFTDESDPGAGNISSWQWDYGDGSADKQNNPLHLFPKAGFYKVILLVTNSYGCSDTLSKLVKNGSIIAGIKAGLTGCAGSPVHFTDATISDTAIKSWLWVFGDGDSSTLQNPDHTYPGKGIYPLSLYVSDYKGCTDKLVNSRTVLIGDTVPPQSPVMYRVSVVDDHSVEVDFSHNSDFDFSHYVVYMDNGSGVFTAIDSMYSQYDTIYYAHGLNTLHQVYCFKVVACNICGYRSTFNTPSHCTINLTAKPGINKALLSWTPYQGWDVDRYTIYRMGLVNPNEFGALDSVIGTQLNYIDTSVVCYKPMIYRILAYEKGGFTQKSWSDTSATVPIHVPTVPTPQVIRATVVDDKSTYLEWKDQPRGKVKNWLVEKSADGVNFQPLDTGIKPPTLNLSDVLVDVNSRSYTYRIQIVDSCGDVGLYSNIGKTILLKADTNIDEKPHLHWSPYLQWAEGVQYYDVFIKKVNGSFNWLGRTNTGKDTEYTDLITDLNSLPFYCYHVVAHRDGPAINPDINLDITSQSNDACLKVRSILWVPNAFTPNSDTHNDSFFVKGLYIRDFRMKIFDRWGTKVFETTDMKQKWGGDFRKGKPIMDAYKYLIYYQGVDDQIKYLDGWVTIVM